MLSVSIILLLNINTRVLSQSTNINDLIINDFQKLFSLMQLNVITQVNLIQSIEIKLWKIIKLKDVKGLLKLYYGQSMQKDVNLTQYQRRKDRRTLEDHPE